MLNECRQALRISTEAYDGELCSLMDAGARDLTIAGVILPGSVSFELVSETVGQVTRTYWQDNSELTDALCVRAILTYVRAHFGSPGDYDRVKASYDEQKAQLMSATGYTDYGEPEPEPEPDPEPDPEADPDDGGDGE